MKKIFLTALLVIALVATMAVAVSAIDAPDMTDFEPEVTSGGMQFGFNIDGWVIIQPDPDAYAPNKVNFEDPNWITFMKECAPDINYIYIAYTEGAANFESMMGRVGEQLKDFLDVVIWDARLFNNYGQYFGGSSLAGYQFSQGLTTFGPAGTEEGTCDLSKAAKWSLGSDAYWVKWAFANNEFTKVILPEHKEFTTIFRGMFQKSNLLERIDIPSNVTAINNVAFKGCAALRAIVVPGTVTTIADDAFIECSTELVFYTPAGSAAETFAKAKGFAVVNGTPEGGEMEGPVETTPPEVDDTTAKEEEGDTPPLEAGVVSGGSLIGDYMNVGWKLYEDGTLVHTSLVSKGTWNQVGYRGEEWDAKYPDYVEALEKATKVVLGEGILKLGTRAFWNCPNLEVVEMPIECEQICGGVFENCPKLKTVYYTGNEPVEGTVDFSQVGSIANNAYPYFSNCLVEKINFSTTKFAPKLGSNFALDCAYLTMVTFEDVKEIATDAFTGCYNLQAMVGYPNGAAESYANAKGLQFGTPGTEFDIKEPVITEGQETTAGPEEDTTAKQDDTTAKQEESTAPQDAPQTGDVNLAMVIAFAVAALGSAVVLTRKRRFN